jgi:hypothetical protein
VLDFTINSEKGGENCAERDQKNDADPLLLLALLGVARKAGRVVTNQNQHELDPQITFTRGVLSHQQ